MNHPMRRFAEEHGQVAVLVAILFLALVFAVALVVNTGQLFVQRRAAQEAADAAALAGIYRFGATGDVSKAVQAASDGAALNGFSSPQATVDVSMPPSSGPHKGDGNFLEVIVTTNVSATLVPQWGSTAVRARAVAGGGGVPAQAIYAIGGDGVGLSVSSQGALAMYRAGAPSGCGYDPALAAAGQNPFVVVPSTNPPQDCSGWGGEAQVDSTSDPAARNLGSAGAVGPTDALTTIVGSDQTCTNGDPYPHLLCEQPRKEDPFFPFPQPVPVSTTADNKTDNWCREDVTTNDPDPANVCRTYPQDFNGCPTGESFVLQPGIYTGRVSGTCGNDPNNPSVGYLLKPGIYIFEGNQNTAGINNPSNMRVLGNKKGDTFELTAGVPGSPGTTPYKRDDHWVAGGCGPDVSSTAPLCGVLLFFTYGNYPDTPPSGQSCASLSISGGNAADLAPESTGTWQGMLVYYDQGLVDGTPFCFGDVFTVGGGAQLNGTSFRGLIYAPDANLIVNGSNSGAVLSQVVANSITVQNGTVIVNVGTATTRVHAGFRLVE